MKALILNEVGSLELKEIDIPKIRENEVLVEVKACGICGSDIPRAFRDGAHRMPIILGHEFAGQVSATGEGVDRTWLKKRVGVFPLIPCKKCRMCKIRKYELCENYSYLGSREDGGFAEYVRVPVWNLICLPEQVTMEQAAMLEPAAVAVHAIRRVNLCPNANIAVIGLGTIGMLVTMFLLEMGCENVYTIGNKEFQKTKVMEMGLPAFQYIHGTSDYEQHLRADLVFECVGSNKSIESAINIASPEATIITVGNPTASMELDKDIYWKILRKQLTMKGTWNSTFDHCNDDDWHICLERIKGNHICPEQLITHRYTIGQIHRGFEIMKNKIEDYGKIMMIDM